MPVLSAAATSFLATPANFLSHADTNPTDGGAKDVDDAVADVNAEAEPEAKEEGVPATLACRRCSSRKKLYSVPVLANASNVNCSTGISDCTFCCCGNGACTGELSCAGIVDLLRVEDGEGGRDRACSLSCLLMKAVAGVGTATRTGNTPHDSPGNV
jgi:hypothetical protein